MQNKSTMDLEQRQSNSRDNPLSLPRVSSRADGSPLGYERWMTRKFLKLAGHPPLTITLWNGERITAPNQAARYSVRLHDRRALYELVSNPNLAFGDLYSAGRLDVDGYLPDLMEDIYHAVGAAEEQLPGWLRMIWRNHVARPTHLKAARENIHHHYDLGNDFYKLWLDQEEMQYTCAYYETPDLTLEQAQVAKLEHVCRKLQLKPGQTVFEAGCGWGGLARYMAREYGVKVRAFNISEEQVAYAREEAKRQDLDDRIEYVLDDYRNITGQCDAFVSVGMLEHVGPSHYQDLADVVRHSLHPEGLALIHTIGRNQPARINAWIEKRIFPGAHPPSLTELAEIGERGPFSVIDIENLRLHYARTLEDWLARFEEHRDKVQDMYGESFVRAWRLYLAGSIAAFKASSLQLFQMVMSHPTNNQVPWNRRHLYDQPILNRGGLNQ
ncbi:cyclopropane-fatty-acyl-phospholipid synthase family protein [Marinobacteraceae bacterium S3BR75-40.1]